MTSSSTRRDTATPAKSASTRVSFGLVLLTLQLFYVPLELLVAGAVTVPYDLGSGTISELGAVTCDEYAGPAGALAVCSPWNAAMNGTFVASGLLMVIGVLLSRPMLRPGALGATAVGAWVVTGLGSIGTGLVPLDVSLDVHLLVSTPVFVAQPVALLLTAAVLPRPNRFLAATAAGLGLVATVAAVVFLFGGLPEMGGALERLIVWPATLWLGVTALTLWIRQRRE
ncbi:uncharacterized protein DUF998 [Pseudonocardia sediminis]|uniref:Uncharacterized protein DUF998 n=1 Tax=Pseudonocardia sediminis TaxID=1397368 RepID=A0A4Q7US86_PSEST|nr:DUF998 domain-containing protein [Pseudonocardia sediminis]RZT83591.1 uncharacterized protein DUF998 [Pseudonocardia sediminis]